MKQGVDSRWLVIYVTSDAHNAAAAEQMLQREGFLVRRHAVSQSGVYELRVLKSEAQEARKLMLERGL